jgi:hypothetical protein
MLDFYRRRGAEELNVVELLDYVISLTNKQMAGAASGSRPIVHPACQRERRRQPDQRSTLSVLHA